MNMKKKMKAFFTLKRRANDGFTLVELIVVIAILAILGGVAVPAYSGYVKKAERANDEALLAEINTAFASACLINGQDNIGRTDVVAELSNKKFNYTEPFKPNFDAFYEGTGEFKVFTGIYYDWQTGLFAEGNRQMVELGGKKFYVDQASIDAFSGSIYGKEIDAMQAQLNSLAKAFGEFVGEGTNLTPFFGKEFNDFVEGLPADQKGNAAVLYVAQKSAGMSALEVGQLFTTAYSSMDKNGITNPTMGDLLKAFPAGEGQDSLTNVALMYGAVAGFVNSGACSDPQFADSVKNVDSGDDLINVFMTLAKSGDKNGWDSYLGTKEGNVLTKPSETFTTDINGLLGALDAVNTVSPGIDIGTEGVWESKEVDDLLNSVLGTN